MSEAATIPMPDPPTPEPPAAQRGKATYKVYIDSSSLAAVEKWVSDTQTDPSDESAWRLKESLPHERLVGDDLIYLGTWQAASRDEAVELMLDQQKPSDRVRLVQLTHQAHIDLEFPVAPVSYLKAVPAVWEINPTRRIGGR